jgi:ABC-type multidrug transport system ATPase subunit/ABC-type multidrug transport system permease subunit
MKALNGDSPPSSGSVRLFNLDLITNYEYLKTQIGYVPQDDIVHRELTVYQSLYYAARLRLEHQTDNYIQQKINQLLAELNISHIKDNMVSGISGGQRKRVSIAVELLTDPMILFLDEPTSPLDPQTIEEFLGILKKLAEKGTTVVMVTHKPEDLEYMNSVIFMAEGGYLVYHGAANSYKDYFGVTTAVEVYANIAGKKAHTWINKYKANHPVGKPAQVNNSMAHPGGTDALRQYFWLTARYFKIKTNDQVNTAIMILQAPIIAALICLIFDEVTQSVPFLMTISALWFGANNAAREIVKELPIYKRERMFNVMLVPYVASKLTVLTLFAFIQATLFVMIIYGFYNNAVQPWNDPLSSILWMVAITSSATLMGLMLSAALDNIEKVMSLVPITLIPQIMLAGIVAKISSPLVEYVSYLTLSRWGTEGMCNIQQHVLAELPTAAMDQDTGELITGTKKDTVNAVETLQTQFHEKYTEVFGNDAGTMQLDIAAIGVLSLLFFAGILYFLKKKDSIMR